MDDAVRRARLELGHAAAIRCWKVRRGGILGFFERESFVAGLTPPNEPAPRSSGAHAIPTRRQRRGSSRVTGSSARSGEGGPDSLRGSRPRDVLSDLAAATADEVILGPIPGVESAFSEVLAQAEAALAEPAAALAEPAGALASAPVREAPEDAARLPGLLEGLRERLSGLGVPDEYLPEPPGTLDGLARSLERLARPAPLSAPPGSLLVVVGPRREATATAGHVVSLAGLSRSDLLVVERTSEGRQRALRRRSAGRATVLAVDAAPGAREIPATRRWIESLSADHIIGAVPATLKRSDVEHWRDAIGRLDTLAVSRLYDTSTPGELMGLAPICLIEGRLATSVRWMVELLAMLEEAGRGTA